jgi:hypothetical protein
MDLSYDGIALATGATARREGRGLFVEVELPMPIGTRLMLRDGGAERAARVVGVRETAPAGMWLVELDAPSAPAKAPPPEAPAGAAAAAKAAETPDEPPPRKRRKTRKPG